MLANVMDSPTGPPEDSDVVQSLLDFLWWGDACDRTADGAFQRAGQRFAKNLEWIQHIRENYARSRVAKPGSRQHEFEPDEVRYMHNHYKDSLVWMPVDVRS